MMREKSCVRSSLRQWAIKNGQWTIEPRRSRDSRSLLFVGIMDSEEEVGQSEQSMFSEQWGIYKSVIGPNNIKNPLIIES